MEPMNKVWWTKNPEGDYFGITFTPVTFQMTANQECISCNYFNFVGVGFTEEEAYINAKDKYEKKYESDFDEATQSFLHGLAENKNKSGYLLNL